MNDVSLTLPVLFSLAGLVYSLVGFAGGSSYLAVMTLTGVPNTQIPATALLCNLAVSSIAFWQFSRAGRFEWKRSLPFFVFSVPAAYFAAKLPMGKEWYLLLGASLFIASLRIFIGKKDFKKRENLSALELWGVGLPVGAVIGVTSGFLGIGGGIFLIPLLYFMRWMDPQETGATAASFIFLNSLAGLASRAQKGLVVHPDIYLLVGAAIAGGVIGSTIGSRKLSPSHFRQAMGALLGYLSMNLLMKGF